MTSDDEEILKSYSEYINDYDLPFTADQYIDLFRRLAVTANSALDYLELGKSVSDKDRNMSLKSAASLVHSISLLRGERSVLTEHVRPSSTTSYQSEMYKVEDYLIYRLRKLGYGFQEN